jgi:hypothetical protein
MRLSSERPAAGCSRSTKVPAVAGINPAVEQVPPRRYERTRVMRNPPGKAVISKLVTGSEFHVGEHGPSRCNPSRSGLNEPARGENGQAANFGPLPLCMELNLSGMATLRHHVENLLSLWCFAVDAGDCGLLRELLGDASPRMDNDCFTPVSADMSDFLSLDPHGPAKSKRAFSNLSVWRDSDFGYYTASVQTWTLGSQWTCTDFSSCEGRLKAGPQVWRWDRHRVRTIGEPQEVPF